MDRCVLDRELVLRKVAALEGYLLVQMAKVRNILVHDYARIDAERIVRILAADLGDLGGFKQAVVNLV